MKKVTIKEVAERANVSIATVSRVLNNNYPVSKELKTKVLKAIEELDFQPNGLARCLKKNTTHMIGVVVPDIANPFFMDVGKGLEGVVSKKGYVIILCNTDENVVKEYNSLKTLVEKRVDAIVLSTCNSNNQYINDIVKKGVPLLLVDRRIKGVNTDVIVNDNYGSSYMLTKYLIQNGHKDICIVNGSLSVSTGYERFCGFKAAMEEFGIPIKDEFVLNGNFKAKIAYREIKKLLKSNKRPTAIVAANNLMAEGIMEALQEENLAVPDDISLVCFEKIRNQRLVKPKLTYINQNGFLMGEKAGEIVLEILENKSKDKTRKIKEVILVSDLIVKESVKCLK